MEVITVTKFQQYPCQFEVQLKKQESLFKAASVLSPLVQATIILN